ncbi:MAG TPA: YceI family protein [Bryobacteraceae bacterium]|jgi:polyisoprenoid-binding protein YceI|nr:YceI family protein [Bryobacteraceae bacterium]
MKSTYTIDPVHSSVQFSVRHMMISNVKGAFSSVKGNVVYDADAPEIGSIDAEIDASTINTLDANRDTHLKSADFLDVAQYPTITFKSTSIKAADDGLKISGNLTIHGVTKPAVLQVEEITPEGKDPWGNTRIGTSAKSKIKRSDFGLTWNAALESGGFLLGDELKLDFEVQLIKQA